MTLTIFEIKDIQASKTDIVLPHHSQAIYYYWLGEIDGKIKSFDHFSYARLQALMKYWDVKNPSDLIGITFLVDEQIGGPLTNFQRLLKEAVKRPKADEEIHYWQIYHRLIQTFAKGKLDVNLSMYPRQKVARAIRALIGFNESLWIDFSYKLGLYSEGTVDINRSQLSRKMPTKSTFYLNYKGDLMTIQIFTKAPFVTLLY